MGRADRLRVDERHRVEQEEIALAGNLRSGKRKKFMRPSHRHRLLGLIGGRGKRAGGTDARAIGDCAVALHGHI